MQIRNNDNFIEKYENFLILVEMSGKIVLCSFIMCKIERNISIPRPSL